MALLYDARFRAIDSSGNPLVGATLTIYTANTTTPASIYTDAALSTPMSNPTVAPYASDAGGWFPQIFAAEGTQVDIILKNSGGSTVKTYEDVTFVGADSGDFERTVTGSGRFKITGSAGTVMLQAGDPDPDDTGGTLVIEGWAGTQLVTLTLDAATTNTTGTFTENSKKLIGVVNTEATTFSAASTVDIALSNAPTGCRAWEITVWDLILSADAALQARLSYDNGATYKSGASDYADSDIRNEGTSVAASASAAAAQMNFLSSVDARTTEGGYLRIVVQTPPSGTMSTMIEGTAVVWHSVNNAPSRHAFAGYGLGSYGKATHLRLLASSGTLTGKYRVVPLRGFGE